MIRKTNSQTGILLLGFSLGSAFAILSFFLWRLAGHSNQLEREKIGVSYGKLAFLSRDYSSDHSFIEDKDTGRLLIPPSVYIYKIQGENVYGWRKIDSPADDFLVKTGTKHHPFPDDVIFVINARTLQITYYEDRTYRRKLLIDGRFE
jgi:hypothetical protein